MPTTLAIHGAGGGGWEWAIWQRVWRAHGRSFIAPDLLPVTAGLARTRLADYVAQMRAQASALQRPVLIGASLGGLVALAIARAANAAALVLVDPVPPSGIEPRPAARTITGEIVPWGSRRRFDSTRRSLSDADAAAQCFAFRRWRDESAAVLIEAQVGLDVTPPSCPVLVIAATRDEAIPTLASVELARRLDATLWRFDGSHVGPLLGRTAPVTAQRVIDWLRAETIHTDASQVPPVTE
jgi:pimeloyl-ACP methyl ester carboxylesterase